MKKLRKSTSRLRYMVLSRRTLPVDIEDKNWLRQNKLLNGEIWKLTQELKLVGNNGIWNEKMFPVFKIKIRRFIRENCPDYIDRLI